MKRDRLKELLGSYAQLRIAVIGDLFLDKWVTVNPKLDEPSVETGKTAWQVTKTVCAAGAAGTVLNTLSTLGVGKLYIIGAIGDDGDGYEVRRALEKRGVDMTYLISDERIVTPTYMKPLFLKNEGSAEEGNRLDFKNRVHTPADLEKRILDAVKQLEDQVDALVILDQLTDEDTGVVTGRVRDALAEVARRHPELLVYADSRAFIHLFRDVVIKCNNYEAMEMAGQPETKDFHPEEVYDTLDALENVTGRPAIVTCNAHGVAVHENGKHILVPAAVQKQSIDVVGAGDNCTAGLVAALSAGATLSEAALMGNLCSGVSVRKIGTTGTADPQEILALYEEQTERFMKEE